MVKQKIFEKISKNVDNKKLTPNSIDDLIICGVKYEPRYDKHYVFTLLDIKNGKYKDLTQQENWINCFAPFRNKILYSDIYGDITNGYNLKLLNPKTGHWKTIHEEYGKITSIDSIDNEILFVSGYDYKAHLVLFNPETEERKVLSTKNHRIYSAAPFDDKINEVIYSISSGDRNNKCALTLLNHKTRKLKVLSTENNEILNVGRFSDGITYTHRFSEFDDRDEEDKDRYALKLLNLNTGDCEVLSTENNEILTVRRVDNKILYGGSFTKDDNKSALKLLDPNTRDSEVLIRTTGQIICAFPVKREKFEYFLKSNTHNLNRKDGNCLISPIKE